MSLVDRCERSATYLNFHTSSYISNYLWYLTKLGGSKSDLHLRISEEEEQSYREELYDFYHSRKKEQLEYSFIDTLLRLYEDDRPRAKKLALDLISVLEAWVLERSLNQALPERLTIRWYGVLITALDRDQRDALTYAYQILNEIRDKFARLCGKFLTLHRFTTNYGAIRDPKPSPRRIIAMTKISPIVKKPTPPTDRTVS